MMNYLNNLFFSKVLAQGFVPPGAGPASTGDFQGLVSRFISGVLNPLSYLLVGAAVVYFMAGVLKYLRKSSDEKEREEGRQMMLYGIVAIFVMISVWGLVNVLGGTFLLENNSPPLPTFR